MAEEEENPGIGCPTVSEAVNVTFGIHEPHFGQGGYIKRHHRSLGVSELQLSLFPRASQYAFAATPSRPEDPGWVRTSAG
jgi:hypothetical protein